MKKNIKGIKNILIFFVAFCMLFFNIVQVSANPMFLNDVIRLGEKKTTILPRIQEVCNGLPYHDMYGIGWANLVDRNTNKSYITLGQGWQCKNCYYVLVTEGNPTYFYPQKIGKYGGTKYSEPVGTHVSNIYTTYCGYCDGTKLEGYKFN